MINQYLKIPGVFHFFLLPKMSFVIKRFVFKFWSDILWEADSIHRDRVFFQRLYYHLLIIINRTLLHWCAPLRLDFISVQLFFLHVFFYIIPIKFQLFHVSIIRNINPLILQKLRHINCFIYTFNKLLWLQIKQTKFIFVYLILWQFVFERICICGI